MIKKICLTRFILYKTLFLTIGLLFLANVIYCCFPQSSLFRSRDRWRKAIIEGDAKSAIYWAGYVKRHVDKDNLDPYIDLAVAYELDEQYEKALECYAIAAPQNFSSSKVLQLAVPRIECKLNRKKDAFFHYCQYGDVCLREYAESLAYKGYRVGTGGWYSRNSALQTFRYSIVMAEDTAMRLTPFLDYEDFLTFMEEEYEKLGHPHECAEAMELFRAIDYEFDAEHSKSPHEIYSELRETIRQERGRKKLKSR